MALYIIGIAIVLGFGTLLWRDYRRSDTTRRDNSFYLDMVALGTTALLVGALVIAQLQAGTEPREAGEPLAKAGPALPADQQPVATTITTSVTTTVPSGTDSSEEGATEDEVETVTHVVLEDESLESIAERYSITVEALRELNNLKEGAIIPGQLLRVPAEGSEVAAVAEPTATATPGATAEPEPTATPEATAKPEPTATPSPRVYTVRQGDTLGHIAKLFGVSTDRIAATNPSIDPDALQIGQKITIPGTASAGEQSDEDASDSGGDTVDYTVRSGDVFSAIAKRYGVTERELRAANPGVDPDELSIGQVLKIPNQ